MITLRKVKPGLRAHTEDPKAKIRNHYCRNQHPANDTHLNGTQTPRTALNEPRDEKTCVRALRLG